MVGKQVDHMYIKSRFFDLAGRLSIDSSDVLLNKLADSLVYLTNSSKVVVYTYNAWLQCFEKSGTSSGSKMFVQNQLLNEQKQNPASILQKNHPEMKFQTMYFNHGSEKTLIGVSLKSITIHEETWRILEMETRSFIHKLSEFINDQVHMKQLASLLEASTKLNELNSVNDILLKMKQVLEDTYPGFVYELLLSQDSQAGHILPVRMFVNTDDVTKQSSAKAFTSGNIEVESHDGTTSIYVPLGGNQGTYGVLNIMSNKTVYLPDKEYNFLMRFSKIVGKALENILLYKQSNQFISELKWLNGMTHQLNENLELDDIIPLVRNQVIKLSSATQLGIVLFKTDKEEVIHETQPESTDYFHTEEGRQFTRYIAEQVRKSGDSIFAGNMSNWTHLTPYESVMAIPLGHWEEIHGVIIALHEISYHFSLETLKLTQMFIQHSGLAFVNAVLKAELRRNMITDHLTGLYIRNYVDDKVSEHMNSGKTGVFIFFDVDNFKQVNDTYGHIVGDQVIKQITTIVKRYFSKSGWICRWGGEELGVYIPNLHLSEISATVQSTLMAVATETNPSVTMSCGVSAWENKTDDSAVKLFSRADKALYEAKNVGKNIMMIGHCNNGEIIFTSA